MSIKRSDDQIRFEAAFAVQVPPITEADLAFVRRAMADAAPDWSVELEGIYPYEANLVVVPDDGDDATGPTFVISRETFGLRVDQLYWDTLTEIGVFTSMNEVIAALQLQLTFTYPVAAPPSVTLH